MTPEQARLVQTSFRDVVPIRAAAAAVFYERLFAIDPDIGAMFRPVDLSRQGVLLMASLGSFVLGLDRFDAIRPAIRQLAQRHVHYGVREYHYKAVGKALIDTLAAALGASFTPEVRAAWQAAYALIASTMIAAARDESVAA